jgi:predicted PurR-regulated permease PerM
MARSKTTAAGSAEERHVTFAAGEGTSATPSSPRPVVAEAPALGANTVRAVLVGLAGGAGLFLAWMAANTLFLIFAGLLFAAMLDACARGLMRVLPIGRGWSLAIVSLVLALAIPGVLAWGGYSIALQIDQLWDALNLELQFLEQKMIELGFVPANHSGSASIGDLFRFLFPSPNQLFGEAQNAFGRMLGVFGDAAIIVLIGLFVAVDPIAYRNRLIEYLPPRRRPAAATLLDDCSKCLRRWLIGQMAAMLLLAVLTSIALLALRVPSPLLLGVQTGLFEFIPYLGSVIAAVPIALMALPLGTTTLTVALGIYVILHVVVGNVIVPLIQKQTLDLPPALALASLTLFGVLFGVASVAVATPVVIVARRAVLNLHHPAPQLADAAA